MNSYRMPLLCLVFVALTLPFGGACSDDSTASAEGDGPDGVDAVDAVDLSDVGDVADADSTADDATLTPPACTDDRLPIVFAHGFLGSGDNFAAHTTRFASNGYCLENIFAFDWNTLDQNSEHELALDAFIDDVLETTGADQVELAGHSAGGGLSYRYLEDPERAEKVAHYVHIASFPNEGPAGPSDAPVPTLNLWSDTDFAVTEAADIPGATNVLLSGLDHFALVTDPNAFGAMYTFFNDGTVPEHVFDVVPETISFLSGRVLSFAENVPQPDAAIEVYALDEATGFRLSDQPDGLFTTDEGGYWGPFAADPDRFYELRVEAPGEGVPVHYYRLPQARSNHLIYLRTLPTGSSLAGLLLGGLPWDDEHANVVVFSSNTAVQAGRDELEVEGFDVATEEFAAPELTSIAFSSTTKTETTRPTAHRLGSSRRWASSSGASTHTFRRPSPRPWRPLSTAVRCARGTGRREAKGQLY